jgi:hypothetical protein
MIRQNLTNCRTARVSRGYETYRLPFQCRGQCVWPLLSVLKLSPQLHTDCYKKLRGLSPPANYTERPPLAGEVSANVCG